MERRLLTFIVASTAFFFVYMALRIMFVPPPQLPAAKPAAGEVADAGDDLVDGGEPAEGDGEPPPPSADQPAKPPLAVERPGQAEWRTLGSMDQESGHFMLVTLSTLGGGVERIELTERENDGSLKYRRVDVRDGYLGYFASEPAEQVDGVKVNVVGPGTPADVAGIQVGDIIVAIAGKVVVDRKGLDQALLNTQPGDEISIEVLRGTASKTPPENQDPQPQPPPGPPIVLTAKLTQHPLDLVRLARDGGDDQIVGNLSRLSCLMTLGQVNRKGIAAGNDAISGIKNPAEMIWSFENKSDAEIQRADFSVELSAQEMAAIGGQAVRLHRSYSLEKSSYAIDMVVEVENLSDKPQDLAYRLEGANGLTLEGWWYSNKISPNFSGASARRGLQHGCR